jgi:FKBP-type peptidyl-prolyl cis-trans isomerase FkpA/FKBP-type peptidyl-prolyl cis-trans isomerase FklB
MQKLSLAAALAVLLGACGQPESVVVTEADGESAFSTDNERIFYALGVVLGENIGDFSLTEDEYELVAAGMRDAVRDRPYQVNMDLYGPQIQNLANERLSAGLDVEKAASAAFANGIAAEAGAERTASGLVFVPITEGDGPMPAASDTVLVHYHGTLRDGTVFDSSVDRGEPITLSLAQVIPCWTEGVQKLKVGGKARLVCPSDIAYGDGGAGEIPGGATLVFEVELLGIED